MNENGSCYSSNNGIAKEIVLTYWRGKFSILALKINTTLILDLFGCE